MLNKFTGKAMVQLWTNRNKTASKYKTKLTHRHPISSLTIFPPCMSNFSSARKSCSGSTDKNTTPDLKSTYWQHKGHSCLQKSSSGRVWRGHTHTGITIATNRMTSNIKCRIHSVKKLRPPFRTVIISLTISGLPNNPATMEVSSFRKLSGSLSFDTFVCIWNVGILCQVLKSVQFCKISSSFPSYTGSSVSTQEGTSGFPATNVVSNKLFFHPISLSLSVKFARQTLFCDFLLQENQRKRQQSLMFDNWCSSKLDLSERPGDQ